MRIFAQIEYNMLRTHPDINYVVGEWTPTRTFAYSDIYTFDDSYSFNDVQEYIKRDLALVGGGGYNTDHITNLKYTIKLI